MKSYTFFLVQFILFFGAANAQKVIILSVNQPPELGFSLHQQDTTILLGTTITLGNGIVVYGGSGDYMFQWSPAETLNDPTLMRTLATPKDTTTYNLMVTDKFGCSFSVNYTVNTRGPLVGSAVVAENKNLEAVLFPNPNDGRFKVKLTGNPTGKIVLTIIDASGRVLKTQIVNNFTGEHTEAIQVRLVNGIYSLRIESDVEVLTLQFVIN